MFHSALFRSPESTRAGEREATEKMSHDARVALGMAGEELNPAANGVGYRPNGFGFDQYGRELCSEPKS